MPCPVPGVVFRKINKPQALPSRILKSPGSHTLFLPDQFLPNIFLKLSEKLYF